MKKHKQFPEIEQQLSDEEHQIQEALKIPEIIKFLEALNIENFYSDLEGIFIPEVRVLSTDDTSFYFNLGKYLYEDETNFVEWYDNLDDNYKLNIINEALTEGIVNKIKKDLNIIVEW